MYFEYVHLRGNMSRAPNHAQNIDVTSSKITEVEPYAMVILKENETEIDNADVNPGSLHSQHTPKSPRVLADGSLCRHLHPHKSATPKPASQSTVQEPGSDCKFTDCVAYKRTCHSSATPTTTEVVYGNISVY